MGWVSESYVSALRKSTSGPLGRSIHARVGCHNTSGGPHNPDGLRVHFGDTLKKTIRLYAGGLSVLFGDALKKN